MDPIERKKQIHGFIVQWIYFFSVGSGWLPKKLRIVEDIFGIFSEVDMDLIVDFDNGSARGSLPKYADFESGS